MMLDHGKHILCEKPLCMNERQAASLLEYAKSKKLFLMEAMWARFFPSYQLLKKRIDNGDLGEIQEVTGTMIVPVGESDRLSKKELGGGTVIDMGVYLISASLWVFREYPADIKATGVLNEAGVDTSTKIEFTFSGGRKAHLQTGSTKFGENNDLIVKGTKGTMILHQLWSPVDVTDIDGEKKHFELPKTKNKDFYWNSCGLRYEAIAVRNAILAGKLEEETVSHQTSIHFARIEDEIRRQIGVVYPEDSEKF